MADYRLAPRARQDLQAIWLYSRDLWGHDQADRYLGKIASAFGELAHAPELAPLCDHIRPGYRRRLIGRHMIYFRQAVDSIVIVRVLHARMDAVRRF